MRITEILRRIWLFSANKIKSSESFSKQPTQLIIELSSSLRHTIVTHPSSLWSQITPTIQAGAPLLKENFFNPRTFVWIFQLLCPLSSSDHERYDFWSNTKYGCLLYRYQLDTRPIFPLLQLLFRVLDIYNFTSNIGHRSIWTPNSGFHFSPFHRGPGG